MWKSIVEVPRYAVLLVIKLYQKTLSPDHSFWRCFFPNGYCKFFPSCSQYTYCAIKKYGVIKGGLRAIKRIARCNPWNCGGVDVP
jgi:putative membrane protein insertion efficiency factor